MTVTAFKFTWTAAGAQSQVIGRRQVFSECKALQAADSGLEGFSPQRVPAGELLTRRASLPAWQV